MNKKPETVFVADPSANAMIKAEQLANGPKGVLISSDSEEQLKKSEVEAGVLGQILKSLKSINYDETPVQRMAFDVDPNATKSGFFGLYYDKMGLTPDLVIKRLIGPNGNELVCQILQARSNHMGSMGRRRTSRFSLGYEFQEIDKDGIPEEDKEKLKDRIEEAKKFFWNCGHLGLDEVTPLNLSQCIKMITRDGVGYGRVAMEVIHAPDRETGEMKPHCFRPVDAGTIKRIVPEKQLDQSTRKKALAALTRLKKEKFDWNAYKQDEYDWVQVVDGTVHQAFSREELIVYNLYPVTTLEYNGYPLTPIDQALNAITTNINITIYNKLYFQNGRAAKGAWVFKSDNLDETIVQKIRAQHIQSINSATNAHRTPVFGVSTEDELNWVQIESQNRDAEFQYLTDMNSRIILGAFQMSPDELPGYGHLSKGQNSQSLSESNSEYKLTASRDVGLRPLIHDLQDFFNTHLLTTFFPDVAKYYQFTFAGLDHDDPEKEATRLQQDMAIHLTYNDVMEKVEKKIVAKELGGDFPLNPQFQQVIKNYLTFGEILENFFGKKGAASDPRFMFYENPVWLQVQQLNLQKAQMAMQSQMQAQQAQMQAEAAAQGQPPEAPSQEQGGSPEEQAQKSEKYQADLKKFYASNTEYMAKAIKTNHDAITKLILAQHEEVSGKRMKEWEDASKASLDAIKEKMGIKPKKPKKKK